MKGPLEKRLTLLNIQLSDALHDCQKADKGNFSASSRFGKALKKSYKDIRDLKAALLKRRAQIKEEFDKTHAHRRGKNFGGPKKHLFKRKKKSV